MNEQLKQRIETINNGHVPDGYKKTKLGIIPVVWDVSKSDYIGEWFGGYAFNSDDFITVDENCYQVLRMGNVKMNKLDLQANPVYIKKSKINSNTNKYVGRNFDILITLTGTINKTDYGYVTIINKEKTYVINQRVGCLRVNNKNNSYYYYHYMKTNHFQRNFFLLGLGGTGNQANVGITDIGDILIPLPPLPEQEKIAEILTSCDKVIELKEKLIAEKQAQKKWLMQNLLSGKIRLKGFSGEWKKVKLGEVFIERNEINCCELELLSVTSTRGIIKRTEIEGKDNSNEDKSKYLKICIGDIGYNTMRMWQGVSAYSNYEGIVSPAYTILKPLDCIDALFFAYLFKLSSNIFFFYRFSQGLVDDTRSLKYSNFKKIRILIPTDKCEQKAIANIITTNDNEIELLLKDLTEWKNKKKALMQLLLTGKVRVNI